MDTYVELPDHLARTLQEIPEIEVKRPHLLDLLKQMMSGDSPVVFIEGEPGSGRSTLCAQFIRANFESSFHLIIKPASKLAYSPDYLRELLAEQLYRWLGDTERAEGFDISEFAPLLLRARRKARANPLYIVVDGLEDIPKEDSRFVEQIYKEVLPIGVDPFRFLIVGKHDQNVSRLGKTKGRPFQAINLSPSETDQLLSDLCDDAHLKTQLEKLCRGNPGRIWSIRRLIQSGSQPDEILRAEPKQFLEFVKLEFSNLGRLEDTQKLLVAAIAFGRQEFSPSDLSRVCKISEDSVQRLVNECMFLRQNELTQAIEFLSETHRLYAARQLEAYQPRAISLQIESLKDDPSSATAVRLLPSYYQQARNQRAIVELLAPDHYKRLLEVSQSVSALRTRAALGARSAEEIKEIGDVFRFALQRSLFSTIGEVRRGESEVAALVALGEPQRALDIAAQAIAKDARLGMLAAYGRQIVENGGALDAQTISFIRETADQIEFSDLGEHADSIAANLVFVDADLAFRIVEESTKERDQKEKDATFARVSVGAFVRSQTPSSKVVRAAQERVSDKGLQLLLSSISILAEKFTFEEVKAIAENMEVSRRVHFLRAVAVSGANRPAILDVIDYALDQIVGETGYLPKPKDLSDLAFPLTKEGDDPERRVNILKRIEGQLALVGTIATSIDSVRLQLRLAHASYILGDKAATERMLESYYEVASIENLEIRVECMALMLNALMAIDNTGDLERSHGLKAVISADLRSGIDTLLEKTAHHFQVAKSSIRAISRVSPIDAYDVANRLNSQDRRDRAFSELICALASEPHSEERESVLRSALSMIESPETKDSAVLGACHSLTGDEGSPEWIPALASQLVHVRSPNTCSECSIQLLKMSRDSDKTELFEVLEKIALEAIERIDATIDKADVLFSLSAVMAKRNQERAASIYDSAREMRGGLLLDCEPAVDVAGICIALLARAFAPVAKYGLLSDDMIRRFVRIVELMPGSASKARCFADLVSRVWCQGRTEMAADLARRHISPIIDQLEPDMDALSEEISFSTFPAIYVTMRALGIRLLESLSASNREHAISSCLRMIVRRTPPNDPHPPSDDGPPAITYAEALEAIELLQHSTVDSHFYLGAKEVVDAIRHADNKFRVSGVQRRDIAEKIRVLAQAKLPDPKNIAHNGYVVVCSAQLGALAEERALFWRSLIAEARTIPNVADRAYVLLEISECIPSKLSELINSTLKEALALISEIPSGFDRFGRLEYYIQVIRQRDVVAAKAALKDAIQLTFSMPQRDQVPKCRREIADLADSIEPGLAEKLIDATDDDPARRAAKEEMRQLAEVQKVRRSISQGGGGNEREQLTSRSLPIAAWKNVGALVANRLVTQQPAAMMSYLSASGAFDLKDAYPVLSWFIENAGRRFGTQDSAGQFTLPLAESLLVSTELAVDVIGQLQARRLRSHTGMEEASGMLVRHRDRESALQFIAEWLRSLTCSRVLLCDPYFSSTDVEFVGLFLREAPSDCKLVVLTSKEGGRFDQESFETAWRLRYDQDPPDMEVVLVSGPSGKDVLHDRWLVGEGGGLRLGTSVNSIGRGKLSEISTLEQGRDAEILRQLELYATRTKVVDGQRMRYISIEI